MKVTIFFNETSYSKFIYGKLVNFLIKFKYLMVFLLDSNHQPPAMNVGGASDDVSAFTVKLGFIITDKTTRIYKCSGICGVFCFLRNIIVEVGHMACLICLVNFVLDWAYLYVQIIFKCWQTSLSGVWSKPINKIKRQCKKYIFWSSR